MGSCLNATQTRHQIPNNNNTIREDKTNSKSNSKQNTTQNTKFTIERLFNAPILKPILKPNLSKVLVAPTSNTQLSQPITPILNQTFQLKIPKDFNLWTQFQWIKQQKYTISQQITNLSGTVLRHRSFQQKYNWFRYKLQVNRISWDQGKSQYLQVDRNNLLMSSNNHFQQINFYKQVKIVFKDEKQASDAGGLLREWMNLCIKEIFNNQLNLLGLCDTIGTFYKFNFNQNVMDLFEVAAKILGVVIGKAIFQRIPLKCFLNYTILRQLCSQPIQMNDVYTYDRDLYNGWNFMINNNMITSLQQNFCVYQFDQHGTQITIPLKQNGYHIMVDSTNKQQYITLMTEYYCIRSVGKLLANLKYGLFKIIPPELLQIFEPHELDMIISGKQHIDVEDLKQNTVYTGYNITDNIIVWFWEYVGKLNHQKLENLLHFVTGNGRVPILGFKYLQSNRGQFKRFNITQIPYDCINPYPKSHTCFNRLQIPKYPSKELFEKYIEYSTYEMSHFGLE